MFGPRHPRVIYEDDPLGGGRVAVAVFALVMFILCFTPVPIQLQISSDPDKRELSVIGSTVLLVVGSRFTFEVLPVAGLGCRSLRLCTLNVEPATYNY